VCGFDFTFSAPKSASVLFALGGEDVARRVVEVHVEAVVGAVRYLERHALSAARRQGPERRVVATTGVIGGLFTHAVNRNLDPHLHSHVVVANLVHGVDGRWSACDWRGLSAHRPAAAAIYEAHLRAGLSADLGVRWGECRLGRSGIIAAPAERSPEIVGVSPELLGEFSSRSAEIRRRIDTLGVHSSRGRGIAWAVTRASKESVAYEPLVAEWERRARAVGEPLELSRLCGRAIGANGRNEENGRIGVPAQPPPLDEHRFAAVISVLPHGGARRRDVVVAFGAAAIGGVPAPSLQHLVGQWVPGDGKVGVEEPVHPRRAVVPANHLLRALGPRPADANAHDVWFGAAHAVEAYRARWGVDRSDEPLGPVASLAALPASRLADHIRTTRHLDAARARLGVRAPVSVELGLGL
jgi:conjugative relaxase-like TrwC/TraI family protein